MPAQGEVPTAEVGHEYERSQRPGVRRSLAALGNWRAGLDGGSLTDESWRARHLVLTSLASLNAVVVVILAARAEHTSSLYVESGVLTAALIVAWISTLHRRPRELAIVVAFWFCAWIQSRYVA